MKLNKTFNIFFLCFLVFTACKSTNNEKHDKHLAVDAEYYTCSMHPQIRENKPGKCPICHMDLIPVKSNENKIDEISLSDQQIVLGNITAQTLEETKKKMEDSYNGIMAYNQSTIKTISSRAMGRIEKLYFKTIGDFIKKGNPVYLLYSEDIAIVKQDYQIAYKQLSIPGDFGRNAKVLLNAAEQKLLFYGLTIEQIESIKTSSEISPYITVYSNYSGYITEVISNEGNYLMEGTGIIRLADLSTLWVETQVNANYSNQVKTGQIANITFPDYPGKSTSAKVTFINPEIDYNSRLLLIRLEIQNQNLTLRPGMQTIVKFKQPEIKGIFIPVDAVIREENATYIWIEEKHGVYKNVMIETGIETNGMIEIKSPIDLTKKIVITGAYAINSEYKFRKGSDPMEGMKM